MNGNRGRMLLGMTLLLTLCFVVPPASAEFRSAKDMQKECRVALEVLQGTAEKSFQNVLFTGECIGYIQGAADASRAMADNVSWYKICAPSDLSTLVLIQKFIAFVDANPKYTLASTAIQLMLAKEYPCRR